jgi:hypothetical protein
MTTGDAILVTHGSPGLATVAALRITPAGAVELHHTEPHHLRGLLNGGNLELLVPGGGYAPRWHAYLDGDGRGKALPFNRIAHDLAALCGWSGWNGGDYLVGPVVFLGDDPADSAAEGDVPGQLLALGVREGLWRTCAVGAGFTRCAKCRFCAREIYNRPGQNWWEDDEGLTRCMKSTGVIIGGGGGAPMVPGHEPMPDGLAGAAADITCDHTGEGRP